MLVSDNKFFYFFLSILPISIVAGPSVSLVNILLIVFLYFYIFFKYKHYVFIFENNTIRLLIVIYIYLIFNSFISIDFESGLNRNVGFIRLIFLFIAINYFFFISKNNYLVGISSNFCVWCLLWKIYRSQYLWLGRRNVWIKSGEFF